jgi:uncharacterized protein (DUF1778 family)
MSPRTGRPPSDNPRTKVVPLRFTPDEWQAIYDAAERAGKNAGSWMREKLNAAAKRAK